MGEPNLAILRGYIELRNPRYRRMKVRILFVLSVLCAAQMYARKTPVATTDSFYVSPEYSPTIQFQNEWMGKLVPKDSANWFFYPDSIIVAREFGIRVKKISSTKSDLFDDCVYFNPPIHAFSQAEAKRPFTARFFLNPVFDDREYRNEGMVPASVRFYLDTSHISPDIENNLVSDTFPESLVTDYTRPFYFRKYEVSNNEYREFVQWVLDSIVRTRMKFVLPNGNLDYKKKYDFYKDTIGKKLNLYIPIEQRFYSRLDVDSRKFVYRFSSRPDGYMADTLGIYPDTLSWLHDWSLSFNEPMANMYFWHPAYGNYPVVGLSYWQCLAFLEWKTSQLTKQLKGKYNLLCALPSEIEWDYVSTAQDQQGQMHLMSQDYMGVSDASWLTDLMLMSDTLYRHKVYNPEAFKTDTINRFYNVVSPGPTNKEMNKRKPIRYYNEQYSNPLRLLDLRNERTWGSFIEDGYFHTCPVKIDKDGFDAGKHNNKYKTSNERSKAHYDGVTGICFLDGNVSEWMREDLDENWRGIFSKHMIVLDGPYKAGEQLVRNYEKYYYDQLPKHGKLVRGCNWYDERFALKYGKNVEGLQAKTFCDPNTAHCTLGFRYVIYVEAVK